MRTILCTLLTLVVWVSGSSATVAWASCAPGRSASGGVWQDGYIRYGDNTVGYPGGVYANILEYSPYVYATDQPSAWVMLQQGSGNPCCYAQVGWTVYGNGSGGGARYFLVQWTHDSTWTENDYTNSRVGQTTSYEVWYAYGTPSFFYFYANGPELEHVIAPFSPTSAYVAGELGTLADQMPGGSSSTYHEVFGSTQWFVHNAWYGLDGSGVNSDTNSNGFGQSKASSTTYYIWDKQCQY